MATIQNTLRNGEGQRRPERKARERMKKYKENMKKP
jgi:hypothetical protein